MADGNYVFQASGDDGNVAYFLAGVFTVSKGAITGGEEDLIDFVQGGQASIQATGSSLTVASDGNFQLVLTTNNPKFGVNGVETFRGALVSSTHAEIAEFDDFAAAQGTLDLQTSTAAPSGGFAFNLGGIDGSASPVDCLSEVFSPSAPPRSMLAAVSLIISTEALSLKL